MNYELEFAVWADVLEDIINSKLEYEDLFNAGYALKKLSELFEAKK